MKLFMSHHSANKPLVREVARLLPPHVTPWIDERELLPGDELSESLRNAVTSGSDYVVLFLDTRSLASEWIQRELAWARAEEVRLSRTFLLPVVLDGEVLTSTPWIADRLYIRSHGYSEINVRELAAELSSALFALISRDLVQLRAGPPANFGRMQDVDKADKLLGELGDAIRAEVFPYRKDHPLLLRELITKLSGSSFEVGSVEELREILFRLRDRSLISGIGVTPTSIYVSEEHLNWREHEALEEKRLAAEYIAERISDGDSVYLDAGSSSMEVCRALIQGLRFGQWHSLKIATVGVPIASELSEFANDLGLEDDDPRLTVVVLGGRMRLNTAAMLSDLSALSNLHFDVAVLGANGVTAQYGLTTTVSSEAALKAAAMAVSSTTFVVAEPAKYGVWQAETFAPVTSRAIIVTACKPSNRAKVDAFIDQTAGESIQVAVIDMDE